jgi:hypothetical protein
MKKHVAQVIESRSVSRGLRSQHVGKGREVLLTVKVGGRLGRGQAWVWEDW